jgi:hypothetical protein
MLVRKWTHIGGFEYRERGVWLIHSKVNVEDRQDRLIEAGRFAGCLGPEPCSNS